MRYGGNKIITKILIRFVCIMLPLFLATACSPYDAPDGRTPSIPAIKPPDERFQGLNEKQDPVTRVRVGRDILTPQPLKEDPLPEAIVGPFELRGETLASALQLILDDYDVSLAFETDEGLKKKVTVSNLHGKLRDVVHKICAVADLYCHYEGGTLTVKKTETFVVDLPPINVVAAAASASSGASTSSSGGSIGASSSPGSATSAPSTSSTSSAGGGSAGGSGSGGAATTNDAYTQISTGLAAVLAMEDPTVTAKPVIDTSTRVLIYSATQRSNKAALQYFARLRKNTALIIFETHIWEVTLNNDSQTGINWSQLASTMGNLNISSVLNSTPAAVAGASTPITITPTWTGGSGFSASAVLTFMSDHGTVKTVSQPQITVLSGSMASLAVSQAENYVSGSTTTPSVTAGIAPTTAISTSTVTTGLNVNITSAWDQSTVYGAINITLNDLTGISTFSSGTGTGATTVQLPQTTSRSIATEIRVRPGDSILIGGLVSQTDSMTGSGPGFNTPLFMTNRATNKVNTELVFLLRPRVVVFDMGDDSDTPRTVDAPKDGMFPPEPSGLAKSVHAAHNDAANTSASSPANSPASAGKNPAGGNAALPAGISPEAFAPQDTPAAPEDVPATPPVQTAPVSLSAKPVNASDHSSAGYNQ